MDELISFFLDNYFTDEYKEQVIKSFDLFDFFEHRQAYSGFIDILNDASNEATDTTKDRFVMELNHQLDYMIRQHELSLNEQATLRQKNEILAALAHLQDLEDYTGIIRILESFETDEEQASIILSDLTTMDTTQIMQILQHVSPKFLQTLKVYIYQQEELRKTPESVPRDLQSNLKAFTQTFGSSSVGVQLVENDILMGQRFEMYLPYVGKDMVSKDDEQTALNILSVIYLSCDGYNSPLLVYRKYSYQLLENLDRVSKVEIHVLNAIAKLTEFKKAQHEALRVSQAGH